MKRNLERVDLDTTEILEENENPFSLLCRDIVRLICFNLTPGDIYFFFKSFREASLLIGNNDTFFGEYVNLYSSGVCAENLNNSPDNRNILKYPCFFDEDKHSCCSRKNLNLFYNRTFFRLAPGHCETLKPYNKQCLFNYLVTQDDLHHWNFYFSGYSSERLGWISPDLIILLFRKGSTRILLSLLSGRNVQISTSEIIRECANEKDYALIKLLSDSGRITGDIVYSDNFKVLFESNSKLASYCLNNIKEDLTGLYHLSIRRSNFSLFCQYYDFDKNPFYWIRYFSEGIPIVKNYLSVLSKLEKLRSYNLDLILFHSESVESVRSYVDQHKESIYPFTHNRALYIAAHGF